MHALVLMLRCHSHQVENVEAAKRVPGAHSRCRQYHRTPGLGHHARSKGTNVLGAIQEW